MDEANKYVLRQQIASILDHPSVYMGDPSHSALRKAISIVEHLTREYEIAPGLNEESAAVNVRTWRKSPWDSLERV
jgi:hypothetical protein